MLRRLLKKLSVPCFIVLGLLSQAVTYAACPAAKASKAGEELNQIASQMLRSFLACRTDVPFSDRTPCNVFVSMGLEAVYGVTDFQIGARKHMSANQIASQIDVDKRWVRIGALLDDESALCAQASANDGFPVIAVLSEARHGHVALVLPGPFARASSWGGHIAPNSASYFLDKPYAAYVSQPLNRAFGRSNAVKASYYYRKKDLDSLFSPIAIELEQRLASQSIESFFELEHTP